MSSAPAPSEIFEQAAVEGQRRLDQSLLESGATGFIAGFTIIFGIVALGIAHAALLPYGRELANVATTGVGVEFSVVRFCGGH